MQIFLSYASEDRESAETIELALTGAGHSVFFDRQSLLPGGNYYERIETAISGAELLIFLISGHSVAPGSFALTELKQARARWPHPKGGVLPVMLRPTPWELIPTYLKSVTILEPEGSAAAEVLMAVSAVGRQAASQQSSQPSRHFSDISGIWRSDTGAEFHISQNGVSFSFVAADVGSGVRAEGIGTFDGERFTSTFATNIPSTGSGEGFISGDGRRLTGTFDDSRLGRYTQVLSR